MFICKICGRCFDTLIGLRTHIAQYEKIKIKDYLLKYEPENCICPICGKEKIWVRDHFGLTCGSKECKNEHRKITCKNKYGQETHMLSPEVQEKRQQDMLEKYGKPWYVLTDEFKEISKKTKYEKYGNENFNNYEKMCETIKKLYGKENIAQTDYWKEKTQETCQKFFGVKFYVQSEDIRQKRFKNIKYDNIIFNSNDEILFYKFCKKYNIKLNIHPDEYIKFFDNFNKEHLYFPDFKIDNRFIEIKGDHFFNEKGILINPFTKDEKIQELYKSKHQCMISNNVLIIKSSEVRDEKKLYNILINEKILNL